MHVEDMTKLEIPPGPRTIANSKMKSNGDVCADDDDDDDWEIELVVQGREIVVSERLLMAHSLYFQRVFGQLSADAETVVLRHFSVDASDTSLISPATLASASAASSEPLSMISHATMRAIVDFIYTKSLRVGEHNSKQLLQAARLLAMASVEEECFQYLQSGLSVANCVRRFVLCDEAAASAGLFPSYAGNKGASASRWHRLTRHIERFVQLHFDQLMKLTQIYQQTSAEQFLGIISGECLNTSSQGEAQVLESVMEWVRYDDESRHRHLHLLLQSIQWPLVKDRATLTDALEDPFIWADQRCLDTVKRAIHYHDLPYEQKLEYWRVNSRPSRWPKMMAVIAYADKLIECFDFEERRWIALTQKPTSTFGAELCYHNGRIYALGGVQVRQVDQFDIEQERWLPQLPEMGHFRVAHGVCFSGNKMYVMGGSAKSNKDFGPGLEEMEALTLADDGSVLESWTISSLMRTGRSYLASASLKGEDDESARIYAVAGCLTDGVSTAEVFDPRDGLWTPIAPTLSKRDCLGLAALDGNLYAVGGYNDRRTDGNTAYLTSVERYDPSTDSWQNVASMNVGRRSPGVVVYRGKIYAVGGMGQTEDLKSVEVFDSFSQQWSKFPFPMKETCGWVSCCLVDKPLRLMQESRAVTSATTSATATVSASGPNFAETSSPSKSDRVRMTRQRSSVDNSNSSSRSSSSSAVR